MDDNLTIKTGIPERHQLGAFANSTLQSAGDELCCSIAVYLPDDANDFSEEELLVAMLREDFKPLADIGYRVEIQIGVADE